MKALADALDAARAELERVGSKDHASDEALARLADAGAQIGWFQVGCCAPSRLPPHHTMLGGLTKAQRTLAKATGGH